MENQKFDKEDTDKVCVKRMILCVWVYMKRRRTKDYFAVLKALKNAALQL